MKRIKEDVALWAAVAAGTLIWMGQKPAAEKALAEIVHPHSRMIVRTTPDPDGRVRAEINKALTIRSRVYFVQEAEAARKQAELCKRRAEEVSELQFDPPGQSL